MWLNTCRFGKLCKTLPAFASSRKMSEGKPVENSIMQKLKSGLSPVHLEVVNESYMHNVPKGSETHFKVLVVSEKFDNVPLIAAKTPKQWNPDEKLESSPRCLGGFGK